MELYGIWSNKTIYNYKKKYNLFTEKQKGKTFFDLVEIRSKLWKEKITQVDWENYTKEEEITQDTQENYTDYTNKHTQSTQSGEVFTQVEEKNTQIEEQITQLKIENKELSVQLTTLGHMFQEKEKYTNYIEKEKNELKEKMEEKNQEIKKLEEQRSSIEVSLSKVKTEKKYILILSIIVLCLILGTFAIIFFFVKK